MKNFLFCLLIVLACIGLIGLVSMAQPTTKKDCKQIGFSARPYTIPLFNCTQEK